MNEREDICANCKFFESTEGLRFGQCQNKNMVPGESPDELWPKRRPETVACGYFEKIEVV